MNKSLIVIAILVAIIAAGGGFFAGMKYQQSKSPARGAFFGNGQGARNGMGEGGQTGGRNIGFRPVNGEIISSDDKSITVKLDDGSSKIVMISDKTSINKASEGSKADLKTGEKVAVFGQTNSDGTVIADTVQINPIVRIMPSPQPNN
jgi:hypothetical protein